MRILRRVALLGLVGLLVVVGVLIFNERSRRSEPALSPAEAARLLVNRNWLDVMPRDERERLHVYRFTPAMGGGVFQDRTLYAGQFELFMFKVKNDQLELNLPHQKQQVSTHFQIRRVRDHKPFDLELTLEHDPRGPSRYYGFSNESAAEADVPALVEARRTEH